MPESPQDTQTASGEQGLMKPIVQIGLTGLLLLLCFQIIAPFLLPIIWGVILAISLEPSFRYLNKRIGDHPKTSAFLVTVVALIIFTGPVGVLAITLIENMRDLAARLQSGEIMIPEPPPGIGTIPFIGEAISHIWSLAVDDLGAAVEEQKPRLEVAGKWLLNLAAGFGVGFIQFLIALVIAGLILPLYDATGRSVYAFANKATARNGTYLVDLSCSTIRNVAVGVLGIAMFQAFASGLAFLAIGVPAAGLLSFLVLLLSAIQVGPGIVILPVIIYAFMVADFIPAVLFTIFIVPIMVMDNVAKPILVARGLDTPMVLIFIGVLGGILSFGIVGLFMGPVVLGIGYKLLTEWIDDGHDKGEAFHG